MKTFLNIKKEIGVLGSTMFLVTFQAKEDWAGGYLENSIYAHFIMNNSLESWKTSHLPQTIKLECFCNVTSIPFRKSKVKDEKDAMEKINQWAQKVLETLI
jgi:hypothetical protein